jgi:hypothetical protein
MFKDYGAYQQGLKGESMKKAPTVKTFDDKIIKQLIRECDPRLKQYIEAQQRALKGAQETTARAMKKIRELINK